MYFFFTAPPPTHIYTLSLHDALPIFSCWEVTTAPSLSSSRNAATTAPRSPLFGASAADPSSSSSGRPRPRSEEHTSELQSRFDLVCRLLLEKKKRSAYQNISILFRIA